MRKFFACNMKLWFNAKPDVDLGSLTIGGEKRVAEINSLSLLLPCD